METVVGTSARRKFPRRSAPLPVLVALAPLGHQPEQGHLRSEGRHLLVAGRVPRLGARWRARGEVVDAAVDRERRRWRHHPVRERRREQGRAGCSAGAWLGRSQGPPRSVPAGFEVQPRGQARWRQAARCRPVRAGREVAHPPGWWYLLPSLELDGVRGGRRDHLRAQAERALVHAARVARSLPGR